MSRDRLTRLEERGVDRLEFSADEGLPLVFVEGARLVRTLQSPRLPIDVCEHVTVGLLPRVFLLPLRDQSRPVRLDLVRPPRQWTDRAGELRNLAVVADREPVAGERCDPGGVGAGGELAFRVHDRVELHGDPGVDV